MEVVEDYINKYTRNYSNEILVNGDESYTNIPSKGEYHPWLTPDHARSVAEIAREETIKEVYKWLFSHTHGLAEKLLLDSFKFAFIKNK